MTPSELAEAESFADAKVSSSTTVAGSHDGVLRGFDAQIAPEGQLVFTRRRRNALAPVAKIPPEVMCTIFTAARDQWPSETGRMKWTALTHVCHTWRQIALSHPPLWAVVWTSIGDHWLKETLERSNNAPSTLVVDGEDDHRLTAARMSMLCGAMANTRRLDQVGIQAHADKLQKLVLSLHHSANNPRHLFLRNLTDVIPVILPQSFYHRTAPRLERLILKGVSSTWDSAPFPRITILDIEGSDNSAFELVAASVFFDALRSISRLQRLAVTLPFLQPITDSTELPVIRLEGLKHFKLYGSYPTSANLLKHLHLPTCATLDLLDEEADETSASALVHSLKSSWLAFAPPSSPQGSTHHFDNLTMKGWRWQGQLMTAASPQRTLELSLGGRSDTGRDREAFEPRVLELLPVDNLKTLNLHRCGIVDGSLPFITSVQHLILEETLATGLLLQILGCNYYDQKDQESMPVSFPNLRIMEIRSTRFTGDDFDGDLTFPWLVAFARRHSANGYRLKEVLLTHCRLKQSDDIHDLDEFVDAVKCVNAEEGSG